MVDDGAFSEERIDEFAHVLPPDDEAIGLRHARGPAHPRDADDPAFLDGPLDLLEALDHGIALPNLRELVSRDVHRFQDPRRLFLRHEAILWYYLMLEHVKPKGEGLPGRPVLPCDAPPPRHVPARR